MINRNLLSVIWLSGLIATPTLADEAGKSALDAWVRSNADIGLEMSYQSAEDAGDKLTVRGFRATYTTTIAAGGSASSENSTSDEQPVTLEMSWITPVLDANKFLSDASGFSVETLTLSDDTRIEVKITSPGDSDVYLDGVIEGYELRQAAWPHYPTIADDPQHPVSRWLPLFELVLDYQIEEYRIDRLAFSIRDSDAQSDVNAVQYELRDLVMKDMRDGRIGEYSSGLSTQTISGDDKDMPMDVTIGIASTRIVDYDLAALLTLLDPAPDASADFTLAVGSMVMLGYDIDAGPVQMNVDRIAYEDIGIRKPETDLMTLLDRAVSGVEIDPATIGIAMFDAYRSIAIGRFSIDGVSATFPDIENPGSTGSFEMGQLLISNLDSDGLDEISMSSLSTEMGTSGTFSLGKMSIGDIEFAPYGPMKAFIGNAAYMDNEPDPFEVAKIFAPLSISTAMKDLYARIPGEAEVSLDGYFVGFLSAVPPIPTDIEISLDGLQIPVASLDDADAEAMFTAAGIETLRMTESVRIHWDEQSEDLFIDNLVVELGDIGRITARAQLGGVPKSILQNPKRIEAVIATLNLKSFEIELINLGGVEIALDLRAQQLGIDRAGIAKILVGQLRGVLSPIDNDAFVAHVTDAAEQFFSEPKSLSVSARPKNPVPVVQILANLEIAPGSIPDILELRFDANQ